MLVTGVFPVASLYSSYVTVTFCLQLLYSDFARVFTRYLVFGTGCGHGLVNKECLFSSPYPSFVAFYHITVSFPRVIRAGFFRVCFVSVISRSLFVAYCPTQLGGCPTQFSSAVCYTMKNDKHV